MTDNEPIMITQMNQLGHLNRLCDVAEEKTLSIEDNVVGFADYGQRDDANYEVPHPLTQETGLVVQPRLFHGFMGMRYRQLRNYSGKNPDLTDFLKMCEAATGGRWEDLGETHAQWLVMRTAEVSKAVGLVGSLKVEERGPSIIWAFLNPSQPLIRRLI